VKLKKAGTAEKQERGKRHDVVDHAFRYARLRFARNLCNGMRQTSSKADSIYSGTCGRSADALPQFPRGAMCAHTRDSFVAASLRFLCDLSESSEKSSKRNQTATATLLDANAAICTYRG